MIYKLNGYKPDPTNKLYLTYNKNNFNYSAGSLYTGSDIDLRPFTSPRHDQKDTSTCVANSTVKALEIKRIQKYGHEKHVDLSILDLYYGARDLMDPKQIHNDDGTHISLACDVLRRYGVCRDIMFPFKKDNLFIPPPILATREAYLNKIHGYFKITSTGSNRIDDIIINLRAGNPVVFGTQVGENWFKYSGGIEPIRKDTNPKGGHAMCFVGVINGFLMAENSWGTDWGFDGFALVDPELIADPKYTKDLWCILDGGEAYYESSVAKQMVATLSLGK